MESVFNLVLHHNY